jgi:hypothetical protein
MRVYPSGPPAGADVLAVGKQGRRLPSSFGSVRLMRYPRSSQRGASGCALISFNTPMPHGSGSAGAGASAGDVSTGVGS